MPTDLKTSFLAMLLEDMFDEWGTKIMFGMRWQKKEDQVWSARYLLYDGQIGNGQPLEQVELIIYNALIVNWFCKDELLFPCS